VLFKVFIKPRNSGKNISFILIFSILAEKIKRNKKPEVIMNVDKNSTKSLKVMGFGLSKVTLIIPENVKEKIEIPKG
jgi:hypothetical protein